VGVEERRKKKEERREEEERERGGERSWVLISASSITRYSGALGCRFSSQLIENAGHKISRYNFQHLSPAE
jgi:hypothetical protein